MAKRFKYKWMKSNRVVIGAEHEGKYIVFKINKKLLHNGLSKTEFWVVERIDNGFVIRPSEEVFI